MLSCVVFNVSKNFIITFLSPKGMLSRNSLLPSSLYLEILLSIDSMSFFKSKFTLSIVILPVSWSTSPDVASKLETASNNLSAPIFICSFKSNSLLKLGSSSISYTSFGF